jgi:thioredoxin 2
VEFDKTHVQSYKCQFCSAELPIYGGVCESNEKNFRTLIAESPLPIVVDFWAEGNAACKAFYPIFERAAGDILGTAVCAKVDSVEAQTVMREFAILPVPTTAIFYKGKIRTQRQGAMSEFDLIRWIRDSLAGV